MKTMRFLIVKLFPLTILIPLGQNIRLRILFSNNINMNSSLNVRDEVSQPYSTTVNSIV